MTGKRVFILAVLIASSFFLYGFLAYVYEFFPYDQLVNAKRTITPQELCEWNPDDHPLVFQTDVKSLIKIKSEDDIIKKRDALVDFIWVGNGFPSTKLPDLVENDISDSRYSDLKNLQRIDKISIIMDYNVNSIAYLFLAEQSNENLVIYHQGHKGDFINGKDAIKSFVEQGYSVLALSMPLKGMNNQPIVDLPNHGIIKLASHNQFFVLDSPQFSSIKFYVEPIAVSLNYLDKMFNFKSYNMVGLSGGGWTTTLTSALDHRISKNYSIAGSFPLYMKSDRLNFGDYEQTIPELYDIATYEELYIMSSFYTDQRSVQIFIYNDPCCFQAELYEKSPYGDAIQDQLDILGGGGKFSVFLDNSTRVHEVSDYVLSLILDDILNKD